MLIKILLSIVYYNLFYIFCVLILVFFYSKSYQYTLPYNSTMMLLVSKIDKIDKIQLIQLYCREMCVCVYVCVGFYLLYNTFTDLVYLIKTTSKL